MKKIVGKSFFDYSEKEKRRILRKAAEEGAKMQQETIRKAEEIIDNREECDPQ